MEWRINWIQWVHLNNLEKRQWWWLWWLKKEVEDSGKISFHLAECSSHLLQIWGPVHRPLYLIPGSSTSLEIIQSKSLYLHFT
jgi:hypothetical protein